MSAEPGQLLLVAFLYRFDFVADPGIELSQQESMKTDRSVDLGLVGFAALLGHLSSRNPYMGFAELDLDLEPGSEPAERGTMEAKWQERMRRTWHFVAVRP
jgi:hypothetical protein